MKFKRCPNKQITFCRPSKRHMSPSKSAMCLSTAQAFWHLVRSFPSLCPTTSSVFMTEQSLSICHSIMAPRGWNVLEILKSSNHRTLYSINLHLHSAISVLEFWALEAIQFIPLGVWKLVVQRASRAHPPSAVALLWSPDSRDQTDGDSSVA